MTNNLTLQLKHPILYLQLLRTQQNIGVTFLGKIGLSFGHVSLLKAQAGMRKTADFGKNHGFW